MAFDYSTLVAGKSTEGSIKAWGGHALLESERILTEAQAYIYQRLRVREMRTTATLSFSSGDSSKSLASVSSNGFLDPIGLKFDGDAEDLPYVHENGLMRLRDANGALQTGYPSRWSIVDEQIQFDVALDQDLTARLMFYETPAPLSASNETNFLTKRFPTLLRRACLMFAWEQRRRPELFAQEQILVEAAIDEANRTADMSRAGQILR
jgi:hypothetical protein